MARWVLLLALGSWACAQPPAADPPEPEPPAPSAFEGWTAEPPAQGVRGMVSSAHPLATRAGVEILESGGNAFDAAVAVATTLSVVEPMNSGMGGYGTTLVWHAESQRAYFLNSSGRIPAAVDADVFRQPAANWEKNRKGPKAISTPGNVNAWWALADRWGSVPWPRLFSAAIRAAEDGFEVTGDLAYAIEGAYDEFPPHARAFYGDGDGGPLQEGSRLVQTDLAASLRQVADRGAQALHGGALGKAIALEMKAVGGFLALEDLRGNEAEWWDPVGIDYRGHRVLTASPPSTAFPSLVRLGIFSEVDTAGLAHNSADYLHRFAEVSKQAFWVRLRWAGDPEVSPPPLDRLLLPPYWREQAARIDLQRATPFEPPGPVAAAGEHTTHFVVADEAGNVVSSTQTLGNLFGSRVMVPGTGIWLNNSLAYCTFEPPGNPMDAHPGRRKLSGDCPTLILRDGRPWVALGTPGGHTIGQTVPQMVMNLIDWGMDPQQAVSAPRIAFAEPDRLLVERAVAPEVRERLEAMGHSVQPMRRIGNAHALAIEYGDDGRPAAFLGGADPRADGLAIGLEEGPAGGAEGGVH